MSKRLGVGDKCFVKGEFTHVFFIGDITDNGKESWIVSNENGNPLGWTDTEQLHAGDYFGEEMEEEYAKLLED
jgi:hypothetical protein